MVIQLKHQINTLFVYYTMVYARDCYRLPYKSDSDDKKLPAACVFVNGPDHE